MLKVNRLSQMPPLPSDPRRSTEYKLKLQLQAEQEARKMAEKEVQILSQLVHSSKRASTILTRAHDDALGILGSNLAGIPTSKRSMWDNYAMTEQRWFWAVALLRLAAIVNHKRDSRGLIFVEITIDRAKMKVQNTVTELQSQPKPLAKLRHYMPASRQPKR